MATDFIDQGTEIDCGWAMQLAADQRHDHSEARHARSKPGRRRRSLQCSGNTSPAPSRISRRATNGTSRPRCASHAEDATDHNLPLMYWYAIEPLVPTDVNRAAKLAVDAKIPLVREFIARRLAVGGFGVAKSSDPERRASRSRRVRRNDAPGIRFQERRRSRTEDPGRRASAPGVEDAARDSKSLSPMLPRWRRSSMRSDTANDVRGAKRHPERHHRRPGRQAELSDAGELGGDV